jgi:hypothetical protein
VTAPRKRGTDARLLLAATAAVIAFGVVVAFVIIVATGGGGKVDPTKPVSLGLASELRKDVEDGGPLFFADPTGGEGVWVDLEGNDLVVYSAVLPGPGKCVVKWRDPRKSYVDCHDRDVKASQLDRYRVTIPKSGNQKGLLLARLDQVVKATG